MKLQVDFYREDDGRWIADVPELPGVLVYGETQLEALRKIQTLALHVIAERIETGQFEPIDNVEFVTTQAA